MPTPQHRVSLASVSVPCDRGGFDQGRGARTHDETFVEGKPHRLFAFDGSEEGKTGRGVLRVVRNHDLDLDYHLLYEVPADDSYAGIAFTFPDIENMTRFRALRVVIAYDPPGGACTLYLKEKPDDISIPAHQWPSEGVSLALDATYRDTVPVVCSALIFFPE